MADLSATVCLPGDARAAVYPRERPDHHLLLAAYLAAAACLVAEVFAHGPVWAALRLLPPMSAIGLATFGLHGAALAGCAIQPSLRAPIGRLTYRLSYLYGAIAWLSGLILTYLLWGASAVVAGFLCLGGGVLTTGVLAALAHGDWRHGVTLLVFVVLALAARRLGRVLAP